MKIIVPRELGITHLVDGSTQNGKTYMTVIDETGQFVADVPTRMFRNLLRGNNGLLWRNANPHALAQIVAASTQNQPEIPAPPR